MYINKFFNKKMLEIKELSGGVTNKIYKIKCMNNKEYIYREYGKNSKNIINRENDINFLCYVNKFNIGPKIINSFDNGRIESFEKGNVITDFNKYQSQICNKLVKLHNIPIKKNLEHFYDRLEKWRNLINNPYNKEFNQLIMTLQYNNFFNEDVIGHSDLSIGNLLTDNNDIKIIDFEYACILPRGLEIANHLLEYNGTYDIKYPNENIRINFIKLYLDNYNIKYNKEFLEIIDLYSLLSSYYWGCWGHIYKNVDKNNDFNYIEYGNQRFDLFINKYNEIY